MKVILIKDQENLGEAGEVVEVAGGYGRNYLIPNMIAIPATRENMENWEEQMAKREEMEAQERQSAENLKEILEDITIELAARAGEEGKLFGSITNIPISDALKEEHDINIERRKIEAVNIREAGEHTVEVRLYPEITADLKVIVEAN